LTDLRGAAGSVVAVRIHDHALEAGAAFINVVGSYASLSLENRRLAAEVAHPGPGNAPQASAWSAEELILLGTEVQLAIDELRAFAQGVLPAVLGDFGPVTALRQVVLAARSRRRWRGGRGSLPTDVERTVYSCCLEPLENTCKHAETATAAHVRVAARS
jgi:signal transduction histidine kinase